MMLETACSHVLMIFLFVLLVATLKTFCPSHIPNRITATVFETQPVPLRTYLEPPMMGGGDRTETLVIEEWIQDVAIVTFRLATHLSSDYDAILWSVFVIFACFSCAWDGWKRIKRIEHCIIDTFVFCMDKLQFCGCWHAKATPLLEASQRRPWQWILEGFESCHQTTTLRIYHFSSCFYQSCQQILLNCFTWHEPDHVIVAT